MLTLDLGCGFARDIGHKLEGDIGLDRFKGVCNIVGDMHQLPFKDNIANKIIAHRVLEHLDHPYQCMREMQRVLKPDGKISIIIPKIAQSRYVELKRATTQFPFAFIPIIKKYLFLRNHRFLIPHKNKIQPKHVALFFTIHSIKTDGVHAWLQGRKGTFLLKHICKNLSPNFAGDDYIIQATNKQDS